MPSASAGNRPAAPSSCSDPAARLIAIGASTGGTEAIRALLREMPLDCPPIVIAQHMAEGFTRPFAARLDRECRIDVREAQDGDVLRSGQAVVAPGHAHLVIRWGSGRYRCELSDAAPVNRHKPSVDVLFHSVAEAAGARGLGIILTGMGADGAAGMLRMKRAGAYNIAQDEDSCVVFGMPRQAIAVGAVDLVLPLERIRAHALQLVGA
jgi:two-component system chemotaxis response regulator CheB